MDRLCVRLNMYLVLLILLLLLHLLYCIDVRGQQMVLADGVVSVCEEHEDSVYAVEWSCADPWIYASLSYDGRLVISRVPRATKYHILL